MVYKAIKLYKRSWILRTSGQPTWNKLTKDDNVKWGLALKSPKVKQVLVATSFGGNTPCTTIESILAAALTVRGATVHVLLCDKVLPACAECTIPVFGSIETMVRNGPQKDLCGACFSPAFKMYRSLGLTVHRYSEFLKPEDYAEAKRIEAETSLEEIPNCQWEQMEIGEHALAGTLRFFARATLEGEPQAEPILRRYLRGALLSAMACRRLLKTHQFDSVVFNHGIYVPQGLIGEVARKMGVRVVNWAPTYRSKTFVFSHDRTYHLTLMDEPTSVWENIEWNKAIEDHLMKYMQDRWKGAQDWITYSANPILDLNAISAQTGIDFSKPSIGLLTNVMWDAQLSYPNNAFPNMLEWILDTIRHFKLRPEIQLLIRVHPAELKNPNKSRQMVVSEITKAFPTLPPNVFIIPPESEVSTYAAMMSCNAVIIYGTKTGVELACFGVPIIVAGEAWVKNKGICLDASNREDYFKILASLPLPAKMDEATMQRARKYAFHFFFRRMISLESLVVKDDRAVYKLGNVGFADLSPLSSPGLDVICDGILNLKPFIFPEEMKLKNTQKTG